MGTSRKRTFLPLLTLATVVALIMPSRASGVEKGSEQVNVFLGSLGHSLPIDVPAFHGLQPHLALAYSSEARNGLAGVGWNVVGAQVIERVGPGLGTPRF